MRAFEFFSGGRMVHAALDRRRWQTTFANDVDPMKAATYAANWGDGHLVVGDVAEVTAAQLLGQADLAWASSPCRTFHWLAMARAWDWARTPCR